MPKLLSLFLCCLIIQIGAAQSPGGISANNKMWLRSDNGVTAVAGTVTQWQEISGAAVTGNFNVQPLAGTSNTQTGPTMNPAGINFNPYLSFDGITNSLSSMNNFLGTALVSNSNVTIFQVLNLKSGIVWLKWETDFNGIAARLGFENSGGKLRFDFPKAVPATAGQNIGVTNILNKHTLSTAFVNVNTSVNRLNGADDNIIPIPGPGSFGSANTKIVIGNENLLNLPCKIDIAEVIIYSNTLTAAERNKIESYLAVKYGFTLNQSVANNNNYVSSSAGITWDRANNSAYANDITGIGRDDATALNQKQSKSVNTTSLVTLFNGTYTGGVFPPVNSANTNNFSNNISFLLVGDNGGTTSVDQCTLDGSADRMQRIWKASITGSVSPFTIAVDQASVPVTVKNILVSANPAFPRNATTVYPLTAANGMLSSAITMNHNEYFSFASDTVPSPQLRDTTICFNSSVTISVLNPAPGAVYNWYNQATGGILVGTGTSITLTNLQNDTTIFVETTTASNCILPTRVPVTIHVQTVAMPQVITVQPDCITSKGIITIIAPTGPGFQYCINGANCQSGLIFPNLVAGNYLITVVNAIGCSSPALSVTIITPPPIPSAPVVNSPVAICMNQSAALTVTNPVAGNTYNWYASSTGTIPLFTGITFNTPVLSNANTYYAEAVNAQGCVSTRTAANVIIRSILAGPVVIVTNITDSSMLFSWSAVPGANAYSVSANGINYTPPSSGINGTTHLLTGLSSSTTITLFVKALDTLTTCITSATGTATATTLQKYADIFVPSAFAPNGYRTNRTLRVFGDISSYHFEIYNRYGECIFNTSIPNAGWDGTFKTKDQPEGTYVWFVSAKLANGRIVNMSGTSVLIR